MVGLAVVHLVGRHQADTGMVMVLIVPIEEAAAERLGVLNAAETLRKLRLLFHDFEVAFPRTDCHWRCGAGCGIW